MSRSVTVSLLFSVLALMLLLLFLFQFAQVFVQAVEALLPETAIVFEPVGDLFQPRALQAARAPLRIAAARDQTGALEHFQVLRDRGEAHSEGLGEIGNRGRA